MQVSVETTQGLERRMTVALPSEDIDSAVLERLQSLSKTTRINGFRPGKVPFNVVKKRYEPQVRSEVLGSLINRSYFDAVQQEKLRPAGQPDIVPAPPAEGADNEAGFSFIATFEVYPEFEPVFNDGIKVNRPVVSIEESDIEEMLENLRKQRTEYVAVERESADGDQIVIDFVGRIDGEEFPGGKADKAPLVLGSNAMIPGFESQLIGLKAGDEKTIQVTFPEEYQADHLAGKETEFDITVHEVKESQLPEFNEELIKSFGIEDGTVESLRADIQKNMERELKQRIDNQVKTQVMDGLVELNPIDVPSALVSEEIKRQREQLMQQMPAESDSSMLADELFTEQATRRVQLGLVVGEIIQQKEIKADAAAVREQVEQLASSYQDPQQVIDYYYGNQEMLKNIEGLVLEEAVTAAVLEAATVVDEPTTFKDIMNPPAPEAPADSENS
ncbi:trigger factor [Granulosicoccus antarcticus]|uniref:Trigger factor n=1 Tax=Granulosicoccus antarcticus IMCC3135 TaxID=1192854 RepID=A0A2Z2P1N7_9GAMM|nr:trigger factor [Granulosicoccus antarcticus]ASJ75180.1 Trigger factor [Granulosicoccus antarcticus IMCC3135]